MRARAKRMRPYAVSPTQASSVVRVRAGKRSNSSQGKQLPLGVGYTPCDDRCLVTRFPHHGMRGSEKIAVTMSAAGRIATTALAESPHGWTGQLCHSRRCALGASGPYGILAHKQLEGQRRRNVTYGIRHYQQSYLYYSFSSLNETR
jgi:hypothetical protein